MFKLLAVCLFAFSIAKWKQNVQADSDVNDLNDEEKRLLQTLEDAMNKRDMNQYQCYRDCGWDDECYQFCTCFYDCMDEFDDEQMCENVCGGVKKRMALAARNQERAKYIDEIQNNNKNKQQQKIWGIQPRRWDPPVKRLDG